VRERARGLCEYCLIHEDDTFFGCQVDHVISEKHGGRTEAANLAYACTFCNRAKGTDLGSISRQTGELTRFFNPRSDRWADHFVWENPRILPRSPIGEVTVRVLGLNHIDRVLERSALITVGRYPSEAAHRLMS
jgi:hypothetical protein